ncbi:g11689 [Coccomyxa viridis]|uniref:G11689 protein n=1 Tax=Coccomyxa viridis TaxID=1274662 RepID=A0ABP1GB52_9CHLO
MSLIRNKDWRIQAFGGLFGGGKKDTSGKKAKPCKKCKSTGSITCPGCKGSGKNKQNGNVFERWKCYDCQGFGQVSCPACGGKGLTPEQRGER